MDGRVARIGERNILVRKPGKRTFVDIYIDIEKDLNE